MEKSSMNKRWPAPPEQEQPRPTKSTEEEFGINLDEQDYQHQKVPGKPADPEEKEQELEK